MTADLAAVIDAVVFVCERDADGLSGDTSFEDIGADSLVRVGVADVVERSLGAGDSGWRIDDEALARVRTLGELAQHVIDRRRAAGLVDGDGDDEPTADTTHRRGARAAM